MDLNYLYLRRGVSLFRAQNAACPRSREAHRMLASGYAARISETLSERELAG